MGNECCKTHSQHLKTEENLAPSLPKSEIAPQLNNSPLQSYKNSKSSKIEINNVLEQKEYIPQLLPGEEPLLSPHSFFNPDSSIIHSAIPNRLINKPAKRADSHKIQPSINKKAGKRYSALLQPQNSLARKLKFADGQPKDKPANDLDLPTISVSHISRQSSLHSKSKQSHENNLQSWNSESMIPDMDVISVRTLEGTINKKLKTFIKISNCMELVNFENLLDTTYMNALIDL